MSDPVFRRCDDDCLHSKACNSDYNERVAEALIENDDSYEADESATMAVLIYEEIPENTSIYVFTNPTVSQSRCLDLAHGTIVNASGQTTVQKRAGDELSVMLAALPANARKLSPTESGPLNLGRCRLYFAGFML